jgi:hypothetical protein
MWGRKVLNVAEHTVISRLRNSEFRTYNPGTFIERRVGLARARGTYPDQRHEAIDTAETAPGERRTT